MVEAKSHRPYASRGGRRPPSWITLLIILLATSSLTHGRTKIKILEDIVKIMGDIKADLETLQDKTTSTPSTSTATTSGAVTSTADTTTASTVRRSKRSLERGEQTGADCPQLKVVDDSMDVVEDVSLEVDSGIVEERQVDELNVAEGNLSTVVQNPELCLMQELEDNPDLIASFIAVTKSAIDGANEELVDAKEEQDSMDQKEQAIIIGCSVGGAGLLIIIVSVSVYCVKKKKNKKNKTTTKTPAIKEGGKAIDQVSEVQEAGHGAKKDDKIPLQQSQYGEEKEGIQNPLLDEPVRAPLTAANTFTTFSPPSQAAEHGTGGWLDQHPIPNKNNNVLQHPVPVTPLHQPHQQQQQQQPPQQQQQPPQQNSAQKEPNQIHPLVLRHPVQPLPVHNFRNAPHNEAPRIENGAQYRSPPENKLPMSESNLRNRAQGPPVPYQKPYRSDYEDEDEKLGRTEVRTLGGSFVPVNRADRRNNGRSRGQRPRPPRRSRSHFSDDEYRSPGASRYSRQDVRSNRARPHSFSPNSRPKSSRNYSDSDSPRYERPQSRPRAKIHNSADERELVHVPGRLPRVSPPPVASKPYQNADVRRPGSRPATRPAPRPTPMPYEKDNLPQKKREEIADVKKDVAQRKDFRRPYSYADLY